MGIVLSPGHGKRRGVQISDVPDEPKVKFPTFPNKLPLSQGVISIRISLANNHTSSLIGQLMIPISGILANSISPSTSIFLVFSSKVRSAICNALHQVRKMADDDNTKATHSVASGCPTQRCLPRPNPMCIAMLGRCSTNSWGFSNTVGSRLAAL